MNILYQMKKNQENLKHTASGYWHIATVNCQVQSVKATSASVSTWMGDPITMSISSDSRSLKL